MAAGLVMRGAVAEVEADWTAALGAGRCERLRALLLDLNRLM